MLNCRCQLYRRMRKGLTIIVLVSAAMFFAACGVTRGAESPPAGAERSEAQEEALDESQVSAADTGSQIEDEPPEPNPVPTREECGVANEVHIALDDGSTVAVRVGQPLSEVFGEIGYPRTRDGRVLDEPDEWRDPDVDIVWRRGNLDIGWNYSLTSDDDWLHVVVIYGDDATLGNGVAVGATRDEVIEIMGEPDFVCASAYLRGGPKVD